MHLIFDTHKHTTCTHRSTRTWSAPGSITRTSRSSENHHTTPEIKTAASFKHQEVSDDEVSRSHPRPATKNAVKSFKIQSTTLFKLQTVVHDETMSSEDNNVLPLTEPVDGDSNMDDQSKSSLVTRPDYDSLYSMQVYFKLRLFYHSHNLKYTHNEYRHSFKDNRNEYRRSFKDNRIEYRRYGTKRNCVRINSILDAFMLLV